jgi:hypothetical protein
MFLSNESKHMTHGRGIPYKSPVKQKSFMIVVKKKGKGNAKRTTNKDNKNDNNTSFNIPRETQK